MLSFLKKRYFIGVDPGSAGALALISWDRRVLDIVDMPKSKEKVFDYLKLFKILDSFHEKVVNDAMGSEYEIYLSAENPTINVMFGKASLFAFGKSVSAVHGGLVSFSHYRSNVNDEIALYSPRQWQKHYLGKEKTSKEKSVENALKIFGADESLPKTLHQGQRGDRAEALLIAEYCRATTCGEVLKVPSRKNPKPATRKKPTTRKTTKMERT